MFNADEFLDVAESLVKRNDRAFCRTATGRAYYALYWKALDKALAGGVDVGAVQRSMATGSHDALSWVYRNKLNRERKPDVKAQAIGQVLRELHANRISADYKHVPAEAVEEQGHVSALILRSRNAIKELGSVRW
jgi:hypothetical protein